MAFELVFLVISHSFAEISEYEGLELRLRISAKNIITKMGSTGFDSETH